MGKIYLGFPQDSPLVTALPCLPWETNQDKQELPLHLAIFTFVSHCTLDSQDTIAGSFDHVSALNFNLQADAWTVIINAINESGILNDNFDDIKSFKSKLASYDFHEQAKTIKAAHLHPGEPFHSEIQRRARGEQVAADPPELRFIALATLPGLTSKTTGTLSPFARLVGALGHCITQEARAPEMSNVRITAAILRQGINTLLGASNGTFDNPILASTLSEFLETITLPAVLQSKGVSESELRLDIIDAIK